MRASKCTHHTGTPGGFDERGELRPPPLSASLLPFASPTFSAPTRSPPHHLPSSPAIFASDPTLLFRLPPQPIHPLRSLWVRAPSALMAPRSLPRADRRFLPAIRCDLDLLVRLFVRSATSAPEKAAVCHALCHAPTHRRVCTSTMSTAPRNMSSLAHPPLSAHSCLQMVATQETECTTSTSGVPSIPELALWTSKYSHLIRNSPARSVTAAADACSAIARPFCSSNCPSMVAAGVLRVASRLDRVCARILMCCSMHMRTQVFAPSGGCWVA